jgi:tetratricopeptide (TPR) repeat protein
LIGIKNAADWEQQAVQAAETALALDSQDSDVLGFVGCSFADMGNLQRGIPLMKRAIQINPANAQAWTALGAAKLRTGDRSGFDDMRHGMRISPCDNRLAVWGAILARGLLTYQQVDEAIKEAQKACIYDDIIFLPRVILAIAYVIAGSKKDSIAAWQEAKRIRPELTLDDIRFITRPQEIEQLKSIGIE